MRRRTRTTTPATDAAPGTELELRASTDLATTDTVRAARIATHRRATCLPHVWTAGTGAAGTAAWGAAELTAAMGAPGLIATAGAAAITTSAAGVAWLAKRASVAPEWRSRVAAGLAASAAYVPVASAAGMGWGMLATLLGTEAVLAARWWRYNRLPAGAPTPRRAHTEDVPAPDSDPLVRRWRTKIACDGGRLAGSELYNREVTEYGVSYVLQLDGAKHTFGGVLSSIQQIAAALQVAPVDVMPSQFEDMRVDRIQLQIITASPIRETVPFTGPRWIDLPGGDGAIDVGPYGDGQGSALYRLFIENGMCSGHIAGNQGSGKSACANGIAISARASGRCVIVYLDGAPNGGSSPFLSRFADFAAHGLDGARQVLSIVQSWADWRSRENDDLEEEGGFTATPERPGLLVIIDEAHEVFGEPGMADAWLELVRIIRKLCIALLTLSQGLGVADFGNNRELRKLLVAWNLLCFRTSAVTERNLVPGLEQVDPSQLPPIPGYGVSAAQSLGARIAPFRAAYTTDWATYGDPLPRVPLDEIARLAADIADGRAQYWSRRNEVQKSNRARSRADLAALRAGTWSPAQKPAAADDELATVLYPDFAAGLAALPTTLTKPRTAPAPVPAPAPAVHPRGLTTPELTVWEAIRDGHTSPKAIQEFTGWGETHVRNQLRALKAKGAVHQPTGSWGPYALLSEPA